MGFHTLPLSAPDAWFDVCPASFESGADLILSTRLLCGTGMFTLCLCTLNMNNLVTFYSFSAGFALSLKASFGHRLVNGSKAVIRLGELLQKPIMKWT